MYEKIYFGDRVPLRSFLARATVGTSLYVSLRVSSSFSQLVRFCFLPTSRDVVRCRTV